MYIYIYIKIPIVLYIDRIPWSDLAIPWLQRNISRKILWLRGRNHVFLGMFPRSTIQKDCTCWCFLCNKILYGFTVIDGISMYLRYIMTGVVLWDSKSYSGSCWLPAVEISPATRPCPKPAFYKLSGSQTWLAGKSVIWFDVFSS